MFNTSLKNFNRIIVVFVLLGGLMFTFLSSGQYGEKMYPISVPEYDSSVIKKKIKEIFALGKINPDSIIRVYEEVIAECKSVGYWDGVLGAQIEMGLLYMHHADYEQALRSFAHAAFYCNSERYRKSYVAIYNNMGLAYMQLFRFEPAFMSFRAALSQTEKNSYEYYCLLINMATVQSKLGNIERALYYMNMALPVVAMRDDYEGAFAVYLNKGTYHRQLHQLDSALYCTDTAYSVARDHLNIENQVSALNALCQVYLDMKLMDSAKNCIVAAGDLSSDSSVAEHVRNRVLIQSGVYYMKAGSYDKARIFFEQAYRVSGQIIYDKLFLLNSLAKAYSHIGAYKKSNELLWAFNALNDSLKSKEVSFKIAELETRYRTLEKDRELMSERLVVNEQARKIERQYLFMVAGSCFLGLVVLVNIGAYRYKKRISARDREILRLRSVMEGEEQERARISRELHDGIGSMITGTMMHLKGVQQQAPQSEDTAPVIRDVIGRLGEIGRELHKTSHNLMPEMLQKYGLYKALQLYCDRINSAGSLQVNLQLLGDISKLDMALSLPIYRIIQELLQNIIKHAGAKKSDIHISSDSSEISIIVEDDGDGFETGMYDPDEHLGIANIRKRIASLGGYVSITSTQGKGTITCIEINNK